MPQIAPIAWVVMAALILALLMMVKSKMLWSSDFEFPKVEGTPTPVVTWPFL